MENSTNFFQNWMQNQQDLMSNWTNLGKKMQENVADAATQNTTNTFNPLNEWMNKSNEMMNQWKKSLETFSNPMMTQNVFNTADMSNQFQNWMNTQKTMIDNWNTQINQVMETSKNSMSNYNFDMTQNPWMNTMENSQKTMTDFFTGLSKSFNDNFKGLGIQFPNSMLSNVFTNTTKNADLYMEMFKSYNNWMSTSKGDWKQFTNHFTPEVFKSMTDKMFGFDVIENMKKMMMNPTSINPMFTNMMNSFQNMMPNMQNNQMMDSANQWMKSAMEMNAPFLKIMAPSKEKSVIEANSTLMDKISAYVAKVTELQYLIYNNGYKAVESVQTKWNELNEGNAEVKSFQEFYNTFNSQLEKVYIDLFATEEYSKLQSELLSLDLEIKSNVNTQMEMMLEPYPMMLKRDMDEVYATNYDLRKRVRNLEIEIEALKGNSSAATSEAINTEVEAGESPATPKNGRSTKK